MPSIRAKSLLIDFLFTSLFIECNSFCSYRQPLFLPRFDSVPPPPGLDVTPDSSYPFTQPFALTPPWWGGPPGPGVPSGDGRPRPAAGSGGRGLRAGERAPAPPDFPRRMRLRQGTPD